ncbi:MAG: tetratricopeptide repeat protein [Planctomycetes bacterium]|nr:tetratricopeptide repeat protein [Planctomycetota bacterium]
MKRLLFLGSFLLALALRVSADDSVFWLDKESAEAATAKLTSIPDAKRSAADEVRLGWALFLYQNDADQALEEFKKAAALDPKSGDAWEGIHTASLARMRNDIGADAVKNLVMSEPDSTRTEALFRVGRIQQSLFNQWTVPQRIEFAKELLAKTKNAFTQSALHEWLENLYETQVKTDLAFGEWQAEGHVKRWQTIGLFGQGGAACYDDVLAPETEFKPAAEYSVGLAKAKWGAAEYEAGDTDGSVETRAFVSRGTCFFAHAVLTVPEQRDGFIRIRTTMSSKVWLNGVLVGENDLVRNESGSDRWFGVTFSKGANVLLVKYVAPGMMFAHDVTLLHADGRAMTDVESAIVEKDPDVTRNGKEARPAKVAGDAYDTLVAKAKDIKACTLREAVLASQLLQIAGFPEDAESVCSRTFELGSGSAYVQFFRGAFIADYEFLPPSRRANISRTHHERAIALDARFVPSLLQLARENAEKETEKAVDLLQQVLAANPSCAEAWSQLSAVQGSLGWHAEQVKSMRKAAECCGGEYSYAAQMVRENAMQQNFPAAFEQIAAIKKAQGMEAYWEEIGLLAQSGRVDDQLAALENYRRHYPRNAEVVLQIAALRERQGKLDDAEALIKQASALNPRNGQIQQRLLQFYIDNNRVDQARALMTEVMQAPARLGAYDESSRRYLSFLAGEGDDWTKPWEVDVAALVKNAPKPDSFGKASHTAVLLEQRLVRVIGADFKWIEEDEHRVIMILSKEGGEQLGQLNLGRGAWENFRLRELRVFTPDGRILEADDAQDRGGIRMPELEKGAILEYRVSRCRGPIGVDQPVFAIDDPGPFRHFNEPVLWTRYAVIVPKGAPCRLVTTGGAAATVTESDSTTTWAWESRDLTEIEAEASVPPPEEFLPSVRFMSGKPTMDQTIEAFRSQGMGLALTRDVVAKAEELTKGCADREAKVRALYKFVVSEIKAGNNRIPSHTLAEKEGQADDLFMSLLRAADIPFGVAFVRAPKPMWREYDPEIGLPPYQTPMFLVHLDKRDIWLWPVRWNPWGGLPNNLYGGDAIVVEGRSVYFRDVPSLPLAERVVSVRLHAKVDDQAVADVSGALIFSEGVAGIVRNQLEQVVDPAQLKTIVQQRANMFFRGVTVTATKVSDFDLDDPELAISFEGTCTQFAQRKKDSDRITFKPVSPPLNLSAQLVRESERKLPMRTYWAQQVTSCLTMTVELPEFADIRIPENVALATEFGNYHLTCVLDGHTLKIERRAEFNQMDIAPERWSAFADFCKGIDDAEKRSVVLRVKGKATGEK